MSESPFDMQRADDLERLYELAEKRGDKSLQLKVLREMDMMRNEVLSKASKERSMMGKVADVFTGNDRETAQSRDIPELTGILSGQDRGKIGAIAPVLLTSVDPNDIAKIITNNFPDIKTVYEKDAQGNAYPILANTKTGYKVDINKPGLSRLDVLQAIGLGAMFSPAGKAATAAGGIIGNAARVAAASAATQGVIDAGQQLAGREGEPITYSPMKADVGEIATAGLMGAGFQALLQGIAKAVPALRQKYKSQGITDEIRALFKEEARRLGANADDVTDDIIRQALDSTDSMGSPREQLAVQGEREFKIPLTRGQRSLDDAQLSFEDRARVGLKGEKAQRVMRGFETETQAPAIQAARENIEQSLGGQPMTRSQVGATIRQTVQQSELTAAKMVDDAYDAVGDAALKPEAVNRLYNATRKAVIGMDKDRSLKSTQGLLNQLRRSQKVFVDLEKAGAQIKPKHINEIEMLRRRVNSAIGSAENATDKAQVVQMKRALDDFMDDAVQKALFEGDDQALSALKNARSVFREYAKKFRASHRRTRSGRSIPDPEGAFIEKIIEANPTDEQIVNAVFGANNFSNKAGANMAARFKEIMGPESPGWNAVRQEAFRRLIKTNTVNGHEIVSGSKTLSAIENAIDENDSLIKEIFSPEEIGLFRRFAAQVKRTQPDLVRSRENPSGTAQVAGKTLSETWRSIVGHLALGGEPTLMATSGGVSIGKSLRNSARAQGAIRPFELSVQARQAIPGTATGATLVAGGDTGQP